MQAYAFRAQNVGSSRTEGTGGAAVAFVRRALSAVPAGSAAIAERRQ